MPRTALPSDLGVREQKRGGVWREAAWSSDQLLDAVVIRALGRGAEGRVYLVRIGRREYALKLPIERIDPYARQMSTVRLLLWREATPEMVDAWTDECRIAESLLDPPYVRVLRGRQADNTAGAPLRGLTQAQLERVNTERAAWQQLPGYAHLHPILFFDARLPCLVSTPAQGTAYDLREAWRAPRPSQRWFSVALQVAEAMRFIDFRSEWAHLDIKPANILYVPDGEGVHCWLTDYGGMQLKAEPLLPEDDIRVGTRYYWPHRRMKADRTCTMQHLSLFQYFATLTDLLCAEPIGRDEYAQLSERIASVQPPPHHGSEVCHWVIDAIARPENFGGLPARFLHFYKWLVRAEQAIVS
jgi:serine/threonine protein kinase